LCFGDFATQQFPAILYIQLDWTSCIFNWRSCIYLDTMYIHCIMWHVVEWWL